MIDNSRLIRDLSDGIVVLDNQGVILEMNDSAINLLGTGRDLTGQKYSLIMSENDDKANDDFHQMILECLDNSATPHRSNAEYRTPTGEKRHLRIVSSALSSPERDRLAGVILSFSDVTREEKLKEKIIFSSLSFILLLGTICAWNYIYAIWDTAGRPLSTALMSKLLILICFIPAAFVWLGQKMTYEEVGLRVKGIKKHVLWDVGVTVIAVVVLVGIKAVLLKTSPKLFPEGESIFVWDKYPWYEYLIYAVSVVTQEFISRGIVHESMNRVITGKHSSTVAIVLSSAVFGALHIHVGLVYMIGACLLLGVLGIAYQKQRSIWGLCIPHFVLGQLIGLLNFVEY